MLVPVVAVPVSAVAPVAPLRRSASQAKPDKDGGGSRREGHARLKAVDRRDAPRGAAATSSAAVLSALLDLPRGG